MTIDFASAYERLLSVYGVRTQMELAHCLNIRQSSISDAKRRNVIPDSWLLAAVIDKGVNPQWIRYGDVPQYLVPITEGPIFPNAREIMSCTNGELLAELAFRMKTDSTIFSATT